MEKEIALTKTYKVTNLHTINRSEVGRFSSVYQDWMKQAPKRNVFVFFRNTNPLFSRLFLSRARSDENSADSTHRKLQNQAN